MESALDVNTDIPAGIEIRIEQHLLELESELESKLPELAHHCDKPLVMIAIKGVTWALGKRSEYVN